METSRAYFGSLKTFILSVKLENIRIGTSLNILVTQNSKTQGESIFYFRACNMLPRNNADATHCEKNRVLFSNKAVYRAEDKPKLIFT